MSTLKKTLIIAVCILASLILAIACYVSIMLSRISRTSTNMLYEADTVVTMQAPDEVEETLEPEEVLENGELNLQNEVEQTKLSKEEQQKIEEAEKLSKVSSVLLLGVDRRGTSGGSRSDTCMIATLDGANKQLKLTSLMRDMYLNIPGHGENRFNSACVKGGPDLVMQTINENFQLDLQKYVLIDFRSFEKAVDRLGGITIEMSAGEVAEANDCIAGFNKQRKAPLRDGFITKRGGDVTLTGKQALGYARMRKFGDGDFARTSRQYKVIKEVLKKFASLNPIDQQTALYDLLPLVETNLTNAEILALMVQALSIGSTELLQYRLPVEGTYKSKTIRGMSVLLPDVPANAKALHEFIFQAVTQMDIGRTDTKKGTYMPKIPATPSPDPNALDEAVPDETVPDEMVPDETVPDEAVPDETVSDESVPDETVTDENVEILE